MATLKELLASLNSSDKREVKKGLDLLAEEARAVAKAANNAISAEDAVGMSGASNLAIAYIASSPQCHELIRLFDEQPEDETGLVLSILRTIRDLLHAVRGVKSKVPLYSLGGKLTKTRNRRLVTGLFSGKHAWSVCVLQVLEATARLSQSHAKELCKFFDLGSAQMVSWLRDHREKRMSKTEIHRLEKEDGDVNWFRGKDTRRAAMELVLALVETGDPGLLSTLLDIRGHIVAAPLRHLLTDPPTLAVRYLRTVYSKISVNPRVSRAAKTALFNGHNLGALAYLYRTSNEQIRKATHDLLMSVVSPRGIASNASTPSLGLRTYTGSPFTDVISADSLHPESDPMQHRLLLRILKMKPDLQVGYLQKLGTGTMPRLTLRYLAHIELISSLLCLPLPKVFLNPPPPQWCRVEDTETLDDAEAQLDLTDSTSSHSLISQSANLLADWVAPPAVTGGPFFSQALKHSSGLVRHSVLNLYVRILVRLLNLQKRCKLSEKQVVAASAKHSESKDEMVCGWILLMQSVTRKVRSRIPDIQVLLAAKASLVAPTKSDSSESSPQFNKHTISLLCGRVYHAISLYLQCFPEVQTELRLDVAKLFADEVSPRPLEKSSDGDVSALVPSATLHILRIALHTDSAVSGKWTTGNMAPLKHLLQTCSDASQSSLLRATAAKVVAKLLLEMGALGQNAMHQTDSETGSTLGAAFREAHAWTDSLTPSTRDFFARLMSILEKDALVYADKAATLCNAVMSDADDISAESSLVSPLLVAALDTLALTKSDSVSAIEILIAAVIQHLLFSRSLNPTLLLSILTKYSADGSNFRAIARLVSPADSKTPKTKTKTSPLVSGTPKECLKKLQQNATVTPDTIFATLFDASPEIFLAICLEASSSETLEHRALFSDFMIPLLWARTDVVVAAHCDDPTKLYSATPFDLGLVLMERSGIASFFNSQNILVLHSLSEVLDKTDLRPAMDQILNTVARLLNSRGGDPELSSKESSRALVSLLHLAAQVALRPIKKETSPDDIDDDLPEENNSAVESDPISENNCASLFNMILSHPELSACIVTPKITLHLSAAFAVVDAIHSLLAASRSAENSEFYSAGRRASASVAGLVMASIETAISRTIREPSSSFAIESLQSSTALFRSLIHTTSAVVISKVVSQLLSLVSQLGTTPAPTPSDKKKKKADTAAPETSQALPASTLVLLQIIRSVSSSRSDSAQTGGLQLSMVQMEQMFTLAVRNLDDENIWVLLEEVFNANLSVPASNSLSSFQHADLAALSSLPSAKKLVAETVQASFGLTKVSGPKSVTSKARIQTVAMLLQASTTLRIEVLPHLTSFANLAISALGEDTLAADSEDSLIGFPSECDSIFSLDALTLLRRISCGHSLDAQGGVGEVLASMTDSWSKISRCLAVFLALSPGEISVTGISDSLRLGEASLCLGALFSGRDFGVLSPEMLKRIVFEITSRIEKRECVCPSLSFAETAASWLNRNGHNDEADWVRGCHAVALMGTLASKYRSLKQASTDDEDKPAKSDASSRVTAATVRLNNFNEQCNSGERALLRIVERMWDAPSLTTFIQGLECLEGKSVLAKFARSCLRSRFFNASSLATLHSVIRLFLKQIDTEDSSDDAAQPRNFLKISKLHHLLTHHSKFLTLVCRKAVLPHPPPLELPLWGDDDAEAENLIKCETIHTARYHVLGLLLNLCSANPSELLNQDLLRSLLVGYHSTLHPEDRIIWQLLELYASHGHSPEQFHFRFGAATLQVTNQQWSPYLWVWEKYGFNSRRLFATSTRLPLTANISEHVLPPPSESDIATDHVIGESKRQRREIPDWAWGCYDPSFVLQILSRSFASADARAPQKAIESGAIAVAFHCMSSQSEHVRRLAYGAVEAFSFAAETNSSSLGVSDASPLRLLLRLLRESIDEPFKQLPAVTTSFIICALHVVTKPGDPMYQVVCRYLLKQTSLILDSVPMFHFLHTDGQSNKDSRIWVLRFLRLGPRISADVSIFRRQRVFETLLSLHDSLVTNAPTRASVQQAILSASRTQFGSNHLIKFQGIWGWLSVLASGLGTGRRGASHLPASTTKSSSAQPAKGGHSDAFGEVVAVHAATSIGLRLLKALSRSDTEKASMHEMWGFVTSVFQVRKGWAKAAVSAESAGRTYEILRVLLLAMKASKGLPSHCMPVAPVTIGTIVKLTMMVDRHTAASPNSESTVLLRRTVVAIIFSLPSQWMFHAKTAPAKLCEHWNRLAVWALSESIPNKTMSPHFWNVDSPFGVSRTISVLRWIASSVSDSAALRRSLSPQPQQLASTPAPDSTNKYRTAKATSLTSLLLFLYRRVAVESSSMADTTAQIIRPLNAIFLPLLFQALTDDATADTSELNGIRDLIQKSDWQLITTHCFPLLFEHIPLPSSSAPVQDDAARWCDYVVALSIRHIWAHVSDVSAVFALLKATADSAQSNEVVRDLSRKALKRLAQHARPDTEKSSSSSRSRKF